MTIPQVTYIGYGAAANLGLGRIRFQPTVPPCMLANPPPPKVGSPQLCRPIWPGPIAPGNGGEVGMVSFFFLNENQTIQSLKSIFGSKNRVGAIITNRNFL